VAASLNNSGKQQCKSLCTCAEEKAPTAYYSEEQDGITKL